MFAGLLAAFRGVFGAPEPVTGGEMRPARPDTFPEALRLVLVHEGGFSNHPKDPGGATNKGVTQAVYDAYRARGGQPKRSVRSITAAEVEAIYRREYWDKVKADQLPAGVDYCVFDFAVNSGVSRAARYLQRAVGVAQDGKIGPVTLAAVARVSPPSLIDRICNERMAFLRGLKTFATFGKGWTRRVTDVRAHAKGMAR